MIVLANANDEKEVKNRIKSTKALGTQVEVRWQLWMENPRLPYKFYLVGETAILKLCGNAAVLCGDVMQNDEEELISFLYMQNINKLTAVGFAPKGWTVQKKRVILERTPDKGFEEDTPQGFENAPHPLKVISVLEDAQGFAFSEEEKQDLWAEIMVGRNHGTASVVGICKNDKLISTAGAYAISQTSAYIAGVATCKNEQGSAHALSVLRALCARLKDKTLYLVCKNEMTPYYKKLQFYDTNECWVLSAKKEEENLS